MRDSCACDQPPGGVVLLLPLAAASAQEGRPAAGAAVAYTRLNSIGLFAGYANDSSPILLGKAVNRKLVELGASYARRVLLRPSFDLQYLAEFEPLVLESDPARITTAHTIIGSSTFSSSFSDRTVGACKAEAPVTFSGTLQPKTAYTSVSTFACKRQTTYGQALSPLGLKLNLLPKHRIQPLLTALGGYLFTTQPVPVETTGSFNFTFSVGAGLEIFTSRDKSASFFGNGSLGVEYRYSHISNANTATTNPGLDAGMYTVRYAFGR